MANVDDDDTYSPTGYKRRRQWVQREKEKRTQTGTVMAQGGAETFHLQMEVGQNYVNGQFLSALIVPAAVIEQALFHQIIFIDSSRRNENLTLGRVLKAAAKYDIIEPDVTDAFDSLDEIADLRNGVVHYRAGHEDPIFQDQFEDFDKYHPNKHGKKFAEKMIRAMLDITSKCEENQRLQFEGKGPLIQGIDTHKHGKEVHCPGCGLNLQDREMDYHAEWDGTKVQKEIMTCPECGRNAADVIRKSQSESDG